MKFEEAKEKLEKISQGHILQFWYDLSEREKTELLQEIETLDVKTFCLQREMIHAQKKSFSEEIFPFGEVENCGSSQDREHGLDLIKAGKVGCLIIAGGQGTRLSFSGPKGCFPVTAVKQKSLFQLYGEKIAFLSKKVNYPLPVAIMTSPQNDHDTKHFFYDNHFFGLQEGQVFFFSQKMLPMLTDQGSLFLEEKGKLALGPDGNGFSLKYLAETPFFNKWKEQGVEYVNFVLIDNSLADPFDQELVGFHERQGNDMTVKCIKKIDPNEKVGVLVRVNGKPKVIEYSEFPNDEMLKKRCELANLSLFCFSVSFIEKMKANKMPLHLAHKVATVLGERALAPNAWKFETFIFDSLEFTNKVSALLYPRERCFAPLKNASGDNSIKTVQQALEKEERRLYREATGHDAPPGPFELPIEYYYC